LGRWKASRQVAVDLPKGRKLWDFGELGESSTSEKEATFLGGTTVRLRHGGIRKFRMERIWTFRDIFPF
jgi:hypothetical protein